jgi:hypothetical protein
MIQEVIELTSTPMIIEEAEPVEPAPPPRKKPSGGVHVLPPILAAIPVDNDKPAYDTVELKFMEIDEEPYLGPPILSAYPESAIDCPELVVDVASVPPPSLRPRPPAPLPPSSHDELSQPPTPSHDELPPPPTPLPQSTRTSSSDSDSDDRAGEYTVNPSTPEPAHPEVILRDQNGLDVDKEEEKTSEKRVSHGSGPIVPPKPTRNENGNVRASVMLKESVKKANIDTID